MQVTEIYKSIQGESSYAGLPCIFVRLTGCNLRCTWCDSEYTFTGGQKMTSDQVYSQVERLANGDTTVHANGNAKANGPAKLLEITGGEPMLQEREAVPLMQRLLVSGYTVLLETSGERPLAAVPRQVVKIVDVKCPHSGAPDTFRMENLDALQPHDELKFVISDWEDYDFARAFIRQHHLASRVASVILSPAFRKDARGSRDAAQCLLDPQQLAERMLQDALPARLGLQIHKFVWDPAAKGV